MIVICMMGHRILNGTLLRWNKETVEIESTNVASFAAIAGSPDHPPESSHRLWQMILEFRLRASTTSSRCYRRLVENSKPERQAGLGSALYLTRSGLTPHCGTPKRWTGCLPRGLTGLFSRRSFMRNNPSRPKSVNSSNSASAIRLRSSFRPCCMTRHNGWWTLKELYASFERPHRCSGAS